MQIKKHVQSVESRSSLVNKQVALSYVLEKEKNNIYISRKMGIVIVNTKKSEMSNNKTSRDCEKLP